MALTVTSMILISVGISGAQEGRPFARARLPAGGAVTVGQPVEVLVEVLVSTWFARAPDFPTLDLQNALVTPPGRSVNLNERVNGQQYFGIRRAYTIYPQVAGSYQVPAISVTVRPGGSDDAVTVSTNPLSFEARIPPEAAGIGYFIGTTRLTLSQSVEPAADTFMVGDALTRTVDMAVVDALSLVLPPLIFDTISGLTVYPEPPVVTDEGGERGSQRIGRRVESVTYVMEAEGEYELPTVEIAWWDLQAQGLRRSTVPAVRFQVRANPDYTAAFAFPPDPDSLPAEAPAAAPGFSRRALLLGGAAVFFVVALLWLLRRSAPAWGARFRQWEADRQTTEAAFFARFRSACRADDPSRAMEGLLAWLHKISGNPRGALIGAFVALSGDPDLAREVEALQDRLYGRAPQGLGDWDGSNLYRAVARNRHLRAVASGGGTGPGELLPLNPAGPGGPQATT